MLKEIDVVDGQEISVQIVQVVEDPQEFPDPFDDGLRTVRFSQLCEESGPSAAVVYFAFPSFCFRPRARLRTLLMIHSIWSSSSA